MLHKWLILSLSKVSYICIFIQVSYISFFVWKNKQTGQGLDSHFIITEISLKHVSSTWALLYLHLYLYIHQIQSITQKSKQKF